MHTRQWKRFKKHNKNCNRIDADNPTIFYNQSLRGDKFSQKKLTKHGRRRNSYSLKPFRKFRVFSNKLFSSWNITFNIYLFIYTSNFKPEKRTDRNFIIFRSLEKLSTHCSISKCQISNIFLIYIYIYILYNYIIYIYIIYIQIYVYKLYL